MEGSIVIFFQSAVIIFALRVLDVSLATIRVLMIVRGRKALVWLLGFCQAAVFVIAIQTFLSELGNWLIILGYAAGFATGNVVAVDGRFAVKIKQIIGLGEPAEKTEETPNEE